ncbi:CzcE family metal-binding protein [Cupriavidus sp. 2TAF22]|uniref:CzcE family metal-binding protein n=1 Tax=unclassified Cupriavidus TaxID=2640874 RepID=UPI003F9071EA
MITKQKLAAALALSLLSMSPAWSAGIPASASAPATAPTAIASRVAALFGSPAELRTTTRTVTLTPGMNYIEVASGESVAFRAGDKTVGWTFLQAIGGTSLDLSLIAPELAQARGIRVYVGASEIFKGG